MTSVWTKEELLEQIAETKAAIKAATQLQSYASNTGGSGHQATRNKLKDLHDHLAYLQGELNALSGYEGITVFSGRPAR